MRKKPLIFKLANNPKRTTTPFYLHTGRDLMHQRWRYTFSSSITQSKMDCCSKILLDTGTLVDIFSLCVHRVNLIRLSNFTQGTEEVKHTYTRLYLSVKQQNAFPKVYDSDTPMGHELHLDFPRKRSTKIERKTRQYNVVCNMIVICLLFAYLTSEAIWENVSKSESCQIFTETKKKQHPAFFGCLTSFLASLNQA